MVLRGRTVGFIKGVAPAPGAEARVLERGLEPEYRGFLKAVNIQLLLVFKYSNTTYSEMKHIDHRVFTFL